MDISFIYKSLKLTLLVTAASAAAFLYHFGSRFSLGLISGSLWNTLNIFLFVRLSKAITQDTPMALAIGSQTMAWRPKKREILFLVVLKFAGLYAAGYFIVRHSGLSLYGICLGFSLFFLVVFCQSLARVWVSNQRIGYVRQ